MKREELEHVIRASADITNQYEFIIIGSQSILGAIPNPDAEFTVSAEADIYPLHAPELAEAIDGAIGEGSHFHETHGYYAQGVGPETAVLPSGWLTRVHRVQNSNTHGRVGYCLDLCDLFLSKAVAGREKDRDFCIALFKHGYDSPPDALRQIQHLPIDDSRKKTLRATVRRWSKSVPQPTNSVPEAQTGQTKKSEAGDA